MLRTARRQEIERRIALHETTAAEFSAVAIHSAKQQWKSHRAAAIAAKGRNEAFLLEVEQARQKAEEAYLKTKKRLWPSCNQLEQEKARYLKRVEELYPAWQEEVRSLNVQRLRELEDKKRSIEKRRYLARKVRPQTRFRLDEI